MEGVEHIEWVCVCVFTSLIRVLGVFVVCLCRVDDIDDTRSSTQPAPLARSRVPSLLTMSQQDPRTKLLFSSHDLSVAI